MTDPRAEADSDPEEILLRSLTQKICTKAIPMEVPRGKVAKEAMAFPAALTMSCSESFTPSSVGADLDPLPARNL